MNRAYLQLFNSSKKQYLVLTEYKLLRTQVIPENYEINFFPGVWLTAKQNAQASVLYSCQLQMVKEEVMSTARTFQFSYSVSIGRLLNLCRRLQYQYYDRRIDLRCVGRKQRDVEQRGFHNLASNREYHSWKSYIQIPSVVIQPFQQLLASFDSSSLFCSIDVEYRKKSVLFRTSRQLFASTCFLASPALESSISSTCATLVLTSVI